MANPASDNASQRRHTYILCGILFVDLMGFSIIFPLFPAMLDYYLGLEGENSLVGRLIQQLQQFSAGSNEEGITIHTKVLFGAVLGGLYTGLQFLCSPIWGKLSDRYGRRPILMINLLGTSLSYLLWIFSGSFVLIIITRMLAGVMGGQLSVVSAAMADLTSRKDRVAGMSLIGVAFGLGFMLGPAIGGIASWVDLSQILPQKWQSIGINPFSSVALIAFLMTLSNWLWLYFQFRETLPEDKRTKSKGKNLEVLRNPYVRRLVQVYFVFMVVFASMEFTLTFLVVERLAYNPREMVMIFLFIGILSGSLQGLVVRKYARLVGEKRILLIGILSILIGVFLMGQVPEGSASLFYASLAFIPIGAAAVLPTSSALVSLYAGEEIQGQAMGVFRSAGALARFCAPFLGGLLFYRLGSQTAYTLLALFLLLPLLIGLTLKAFVHEDLQK